MNKSLWFWLNRRLFLLLTGVLSCLFVVSVPCALSQNPAEVARSANDFVDSIGVVVHLNRTNSAYNNYEEVIKPRLQELGVRHVRDGFSPTDTTTLERFADLGSLGIKSTLVMDPRHMPKPTQAIAVIHSLAGSVEAVEGPNEWDVWEELTYQDKTFPMGVQTYQAELYNTIKNNPTTAHLDVLAPTVAHWWNAPQLTNVACDYGAMHSYAGGQIPTSHLDSHWIPSAQLICPGKPIVATEAGWHNAMEGGGGQPGVSELAASKYVPRLYLEYFNRGIKRAYINEFIDKWRNGSKEAHFGLVRHDGTPKPAFIALKNLIALLQDSGGGAAVPGALTYSLAGDTSNIHHTLLQKSDGRFFLVLWQDVPSFDLDTKTDIAVASKPVTLDLASPMLGAAVYQPVESTAPIAQYAYPRQLRLAVPDHPLVVELMPTQMLTSAS